MRYTPAGVPVVNFVLQHASEQAEAAQLRQVACEVNVVLVGDDALFLKTAKLNERYQVTGFLARKSKHSKSLVLHAQTLRFLPD